jgi:hypothetical protein
MKTIPGVLEEIRYDRTGPFPGRYKHAYQTPAEIRLKPSGGLDIEPLVPGTRLWSDGDSGPWLDNRPKEAAMATRTKHHGGHHAKRRHHGHHRHNPFLASFNPGGIGGALAQSFSMHGLQDSLRAGVFVGLGAAGNKTAEKVLFSYFTFLTPYAVATDYTSIAFRGGARLGIAALLRAVIPIKGMDGIIFHVGQMLAAVTSTLLEVLGYSFTIGSGVPVETLANRVGLTTVAGAGNYIPRPPQSALRSYVARPMMSSNLGSLAAITEGATRSGSLVL